MTPTLRERLLGRQRPTAEINLAIEDTTPLAREVALAEEAWRSTHLMMFGDDRDKSIKQAKRDLDRAISKLDGAYAKVTVRAMPPEEFEALVAAHPPRADKELPDEDKGEVWNSATFPRALFLACADGELSRNEWEKFLDDQCSQAERDQLYLAAQVVNTRAPGYAVPKG